MIDLSPVPGYPGLRVGVERRGENAWVVVQCDEPPRLTAQQAEAFGRLIDRARCIVESGVGDMQ